jgi:hypothetical protein
MVSIPHTKKQLRKPRHLRSVRVSITLAPALIAAAEAIVRQHQYNGISDYIQARIRHDAGIELAA